MALFEIDDLKITEGNVLRIKNGKFFRFPYLTAHIYGLFFLEELLVAAWPLLLKAWEEHPWVWIGILGPNMRSIMTQKGYENSDGGNITAEQLCPFYNLLWRVLESEGFTVKILSASHPDIQGMCLLLGRTR